VSEPEDGGRGERVDEPKPSKQSSTDDTQQEAEGLGYDVPKGVKAVKRNSYEGNIIIVGGDFYGSVDGDDAGRGGAIEALDVTNAVEDRQRTFVEPPFFAELERELRARRAVLLTGGACGTLTAAGAALLAAGNEPIVELPAGTSARDLVSAIGEICRKHERAGVVIESVDAKTLAGIAGFELRRLREALASKAAVVLTARTDQARPADGIPTIAAAPPPAARLVEVVAGDRGLDPAARDRALKALDLLTPPISPSVAVELVERAAGADSPEALAAVVSGQSGTLDEWLGAEPSARQVASLAAAATLDGLPSVDVESETARLTELLEGEVEPSSEGKRFAAADRGWPAGVVAVGRAPIATHFGRQEAEVIEVLEPHTRDGVVTYLWHRLGGDFRRPYLDWLLRLPVRGSARVRSGAAVTAGILFVDDPVAAEDELLYPWASADDWRQRTAAALALGVPVAFGADPTAARAVASAWATSPRQALRRVAISAYGGMLGAWDPGSAAAAHLWRIGDETADLTRSADHALAWLMVAGGDARRARASVVGILGSQRDAGRRPARVYRLLPMLTARLASGSEPARESFAALFDDAEQESLAGLAELLVEAFDSSTLGHESARAALRSLLSGLGSNDVDQELVNGLIRAMKAAAARRGRLGALGSQLERVLRAEIRGKGTLREPARAVHATFYNRKSNRKTLEGS
jgi:hypothetical protein